MELTPLANSKLITDCLAGLTDLHILFAIGIIYNCSTLNVRSAGLGSSGLIICAAHLL